MVRELWFRSILKKAAVVYFKLLYKHMSVRTKCNSEKFIRLLGQDSKHETSTIRSRNTINSVTPFGHLREVPLLVASRIQVDSASQDAIVNQFNQIQFLYDVLLYTPPSMSNSRKYSTLFFKIRMYFSIFMRATYPYTSSSFLRYSYLMKSADHKASYYAAVSILLCVSLS
jgi:hypothetical protein